MPKRRRVRRFLVEVTEIFEDTPTRVEHQAPPPIETRQGWLARQWRGRGQDPAVPVEWEQPQKAEA